MEKGHFRIATLLTIALAMIIGQVGLVQISAAFAVPQEQIVTTVNGRNFVQGEEIAVHTRVIVPTTDKVRFDSFESEFASFEGP